MTISDLNDINVITFIWWVLLVATIILVGGYAVYLLDLVSSGKLSQYIVMPKIKVIELPDDEPEPDESDAAGKPVKKPAEAPVEKSEMKPESVKSKSEKTEKTEARAEKTDQPAEATAPKVPKEPTEPVEPGEPAVPQVENHKKDLKSAQNLHNINKNK